MHVSGLQPQPVHGRQMTDRIAHVRMRDELRLCGGAGGEVQEQQILGTRRRLRRELRDGGVRPIVPHPALHAWSHGDPQRRTRQSGEAPRKARIGHDRLHLAALETIAQILALQQRRGRDHDRAEPDGREHRFPQRHAVRQHDEQAIPRAQDRLLIMLPNSVPLWETMLAAIRLGAVMIPATTLLEREDLRDRLERGQVKAIVTDADLAGRFAGLPGAPLRIAVGRGVQGWVGYDRSHAAVAQFAAQAPTRAEDLLLLYFTSGTTAQPKLVAHTHVSYPVGHLSTMYWLGLKPGDVHLNLSSPGWAKHAWSSFFAPWNAQATILAYQYERFDARALLEQLVRCRVTSFCAPPTVWRMLIQHDLRAWRVSLRELASAGEPLNPE